jgi:cyanophycin synthetase
LFFGRLPSGTVVFEGLPRPDGSGGLEWIDNKALMKKVCHKTGIPTPNGRACFSLSAARKIFGKLEKPVVVKPALGSRSRHVRVHIKTEQAMAEAFWAAKQVSPVVVIEEELKGMVHRATVVGGKVRGVLRREPGFVVGDGVRTISQLVEEENKNPLRRGPIFHPIPINADFYAEIANQGFSENDLPPKGRLVTVSLKIGRSQGGTNTDVTDLVHSENLELFERIAAVFGESLVGIDFIIEDVSRSWRQQPLSGIIECNSVPFLDLHSFPFVGRPRDLFSALWDEVLKNQKVQFPKT